MAVRSWFEKDFLRRVGLAALGGVFYFLDFPGMDVWSLVFVAVVPLFFALRDVTPRRALFLGWVFGFVANCCGYYWLVGMLENFSGFGWFVSALLAGILAAYQGMLPGVFGWLWAKTRPTQSKVLSLVCACSAFVASEWLYPLLFPTFFGNALHDVPHLMQGVDLGGPLVLTWFVIAVNAAIYEAWVSWRAKEKMPWAVLGLAGGTVLAAIVYGHVRIAQVDARVRNAPKITVGLVQVNMGIFQKREDPAEGWRRHVEQTLQLEREVRPDLVVWPESAYTYYLPTDKRNIREWVMGPVKTPLLFGGLARRPFKGRDRSYNTAFLVSGRGDVQGTYDKTFLLPFGEYIPFGDDYPVLYEISPNTGQFSPGQHTRPLQFGPWRITAMICFEDVVPTFVRKAVAQGNPHLLVNLTNDSWYGDTTEPWIHLALAKFRAVEHHRYLVRVTNSGVSAIIDPVGRVLTHSKVMTRENLHGRVAMLEGSTLYESFGNWPGWMSVLVLGWLWVRKKYYA